MRHAGWSERLVSNHGSINSKVERPTTKAHPFLASQNKPSKAVVKTQPKPSFHFLASLYVDGRRDPERKVVVYLDPEDDDFNQPTGEVLMKARWVQRKNGDLREESWVFGDVGIETLFDQMIIRGDIDPSLPVAAHDEAALIKAMEDSHITDQHNTLKEERIEVGKIVVVLKRITLGEKWEDKNFKAKHEEGDTEDVEMNGINSGITHRTE
jgi:hypothetical protein